MPSIHRIVGAGTLLCFSGPGSLFSPLQATAKAGLVVSVKDYGAVGNGTTADTNAIQRAVNAVMPGGTVRFPPGTYKIETDKGVTLKDDIRLDMEGATLVGPNVAGAR